MVYRTKMKKAVARPQKVQISHSVIQYQCVPSFRKRMLSSRFCNAVTAELEIWFDI